MRGTITKKNKIKKKRGRSIHICASYTRMERTKITREKDREKERTEKKKKKERIHT